MSPARQRSGEVWLLLIVHPALEPDRQVVQARGWAGTTPDPGGCSCMRPCPNPTQPPLKCVESHHPLQRHPKTHFEKITAPLSTGTPPHLRITSQTQHCTALHAFRSHGIHTALTSVRLILVGCRHDVSVFPLHCPPSFPVISSLSLSDPQADGTRRDQPEKIFQTVFSWVASAWQYPLHCHASVYCTAPCSSDVETGF